MAGLLNFGQRAKERYLHGYLTFLNEYLRLLYHFRPYDLPEPLRSKILNHLRLVNKELFGKSGDSLNDLPPQKGVSYHHFSRMRLGDIQNRFPPPQDIDALYDELAHATVQECRRRGDTILGSQMESDPPTYHVWHSPYVTVPAKERYRHMLVIGKTGAGKSNLLKYIIDQDLQNENQGVIILSPEEGIFHTLLNAVPVSRFDDIVYIEPTDRNSPSFNPFDFTEADGLSDDDRQLLLTDRAGELYTIFVAALGDLGRTMSTLVRNSVYALLQMPNTTMLDMERLIDPKDGTFRAEVMASPDVDDRTKRFFGQYETSGYFKSAYDPVVNRLDPFFRPPLSIVLSRSTFSFHHIINGSTPKIILLNLSRLREEQASILGQMIIAEVQQALQRRNTIPEQHRVGYHFYIDEFSKFSAASQIFEELFERGRKLRIGMCLATQVLYDIPPALLAVVMGNIVSMVVMELAARDAAHFSRELQLYAYNERTGERGSHAPEIIQNLAIGQGVAKIPQFNYGIPVQIPEYMEPDYPGATEDAQTLITLSKVNYGPLRELYTPTEVDDDVEAEPDEAYDDGQGPVLPIFTTDIPHHCLDRCTEVGAYDRDPASFGEDELAERFKTLHPVIKAVAASPRNAELYQSIGDTHGLTDTQLKALAEQVGFVLFGITPPFFFTDNVMRHLDLTFDPASDVAIEAALRFFHHCRRALRELHGLSEADCLTTDERRKRERAEAAAQAEGQPKSLEDLLKRFDSFTRRALRLLDIPGTMAALKTESSLEKESDALTDDVVEVLTELVLECLSDFVPIDQDELASRVESQLKLPESAVAAVAEKLFKLVIMPAQELIDFTHNQDAILDNIVERSATALEREAERNERDETSELPDEITRLPRVRFEVE
jgi:hypothetical protein